jgi:hypothetical protein
MKIWHFLRFRKPEKLRQKRERFTKNLTKLFKSVDRSGKPDTYRDVFEVLYN